MLKPPWGPLKTFEESLRSIDEAKINNRITSESFENLNSKTYKDQMVKAFRFFMLIDKEGNATEHLVSYLASSDEGKKAKICELVKKAYSGIFEQADMGNRIDYKMLFEYFSRYSEKSPRERMLRFFNEITKYCGIITEAQSAGAIAIRRSGHTPGAGAESQRGTAISRNADQKRPTMVYQLIEELPPIGTRLDEQRIRKTINTFELLLGYYYDTESVLASTRRERG